MPDFHGRGVNISLRTSNLDATTVKDIPNDHNAAEQAAHHIHKILAAGNVMSEHRLLCSNSDLSLHLLNRATDKTQHDTLELSGLPHHAPIFFYCVRARLTPETPWWYESKRALAMEVQVSLNHWGSHNAKGEICDIRIDVYINGMVSNSSVMDINAAIRRYKHEHGVVIKTISGAKVGLHSELPWVYDSSDSDAANGMPPPPSSSVAQLPFEQTSSARWYEINNLLRNEIARVNNQGRHVLVEYLTRLVTLPLPKEAFEMRGAGGKRLGILDVVLTLGNVRYIGNHQPSNISRSMETSNSSKIVDDHAGSSSPVKRARTKAATPSPAPSQSIQPKGRRGPVVLNSQDTSGIDRKILQKGVFMPAGLTEEEKIEEQIRKIQLEFAAGAANGLNERPKRRATRGIASKRDSDGLVKANGTADTSGLKGKAGKADMNGVKGELNEHQMSSLGPAGAALQVGESGRPRVVGRERNWVFAEAEVLCGARYLL